MEHVIKQLFENMGLFLQNPSLILDNIIRNAGDAVKTTKAEYIDVMKKAADIKMHPKKVETRLAQGKAKVSLLVVFNLFEILQLADDKEKAKKDAAELK